MAEKCLVDYFDSFKMQNRFNQDGLLLQVRSDDMAVVEVNYPIKKRIVVPIDCVTTFS